MISKVKGKGGSSCRARRARCDVCFCSSFPGAFVFGSCGGTQNQTSICCLGPWPSQMFELRFLCQSRNKWIGALGADAPSLSRYDVRPGRVRLKSPVYGRRQLCCDAAVNLASHEGTLSAIDGQEVCCQLAGNGDRSLVAV